MNRQGSNTNCVLLTVIIKTLNEAHNINRTIESVIESTRNINVQIIVADSCSTDATVALACKYPVMVVVLADATERSCGIGGQLGFQYALGEYVYIVDGDMQILPDFVVAALDVLSKNLDVAGVGGMMEEMSNGIEFRSRGQRFAKRLDRKPGLVDRLNGGGIYRRKALIDVGYLTDRNLHSYEELELANRLRAKGWKLIRVSIIAMQHYGHSIDPWKLMIARWSTGYAKGPGELLRATRGMEHRWQVLREFKTYVAMVAVWLFTLVALWLGYMHGNAWLWFVAVWPIMIIAMAIRKRSLMMSLHTVAYWQIFALGMLVGFFAKRKAPTTAILAKVIMPQHRV